MSHVVQINLCFYGVKTMTLKRGIENNPELGKKKYQN